MSKRIKTLQKNKKSRKLRYQKVILKISGEFFGSKTETFNKKTIDYISKQIIEVSSMGVKIGIVVGGGNIIRGREAKWIDKVDADVSGMIATIINGLVIYSQLRKNNIRTKICSGIEVNGIVKRCNKFDDLSSYISGDVFIFVGGTGNPFFTTDTAAALRAVEFGADILIKGTKVEGVYSADPQKNQRAIFYRRLKFEEAMAKKLEVMDLAAFNICKEAGIPICVYNFMKYPLSNIIKNKKVGTLITNGG